MLNILVICTGNSCRSIIGEAVFNHLGQGRISAYSAGSHPKGRINPEALDLLQRHDINTTGLTSKSWDSLSTHAFNIVITVCDRAQQESCPSYLSKAIKIHWPTLEPSHVAGGDKERHAAFEATYKIFAQRIEHLLALSLDPINPETLSALSAIE
ncbi:MAG: arsenate reductase ArsC [Methyloprofundus sp.]|nr:arsenate reductase ArsC [Methyloprofundus sp.]